MIDDIILRKTTPLISVVKAAIIDTYDDIGATQERFTHWAARGLKKLQMEGSISVGVRRVLLPVNMNFQTATLPSDFDYEIFVGRLDEDGQRIPFNSTSHLAPYESVERIENCPVCDKCNQNLNICNDMQVSEEVSLVQIGGANYEQTTVKKLYPNGDYYLETTTPALNNNTGVVEYYKTKEFVNNFDLKDCGCLADTEVNKENVKKYCPDVYASYYSCDCSCDTRIAADYQIFDEQGIIQLDLTDELDYLYLEYIPFMPKIKGQYHVPRVAFETLVEWTKYKSVQNKKNLNPNLIRQWFDNYRMARANMTKRLGWISLTDVMQIIFETPKFEITMNNGWRDCYRANKLLAQKNRNCNALPASNSQPTVQTQSGPEVVVRVVEKTNQIVYGKVEFEVGQPASLLLAGDTVLTINDTGILENSVNVVVDNVPLSEGRIDELSIQSIVYGANAVAITFNAPAVDTQKYKITYTKAVTI